MSPADAIDLFESRMALTDALLLKGLIGGREYEQLRTAALAGIDAAYQRAAEGAAKFLMESPFESTSLNPEAAVPVQPRCATPPIHSKETKK